MIMDAVGLWKRRAGRQQERTSSFTVKFLPLEVIHYCTCVINLAQYVTYYDHSWGMKRAETPKQFTIYI